MNKFMAFCSAVVLVLCLVCYVIGQGLPNIPVPDDFYDGGARKAQVDAIPGAPALTTVATGLTNVVTISAHGQSANAIAGRYLLRVWTAATSMGEPSTNNIESVTLAGGSAIQEVVSDAHYVYLTGANGTATATIVGTAAGTNHVMVAIGGNVASMPIVFTE